MNERTKRKKGRKKENKCVSKATGKARGSLSSRLHPLPIVGVSYVLVRGLVLRQQVDVEEAEPPNEPETYEDICHHKHGRRLLPHCFDDAGLGLVRFVSLGLQCSLYSPNTGRVGVWVGCTLFWFYFDLAGVSLDFLT